MSQPAKMASTPSEWLAAFTLGEACRLLAHTQKSVKEIAELLHFPEQFTFRKYFKTYIGVSPRAYRAHPIGITEKDTPTDEKS